jgi:hypothetical protein
MAVRESVTTVPQPLSGGAWRRAARPGAWSPGRLREIARQWDRPYQLWIEEPIAIAYYPDAKALGPTLRRALPLERVALRGGGAAWRQL